MTPRALPLPGDPDAPKFWRHEVGGQLARAVNTYLLAPAEMTLRDIALVRAYLSQWIQSPTWDLNPSHDENSRAALARLRAGVGAILTVADIHAWLWAALDEGIDPL